MNSVKLCFTFLAMFFVACASETKTDSPATSAVSSPTVSQTPVPFADARRVYLKQCSECHGENGDGGQVKIDGKQVRVPSFKKGHALKHSDEDFVTQIAEGGDGMPAFKDKVQPDEIKELVRFIRKEFQGK